MNFASLYGKTASMCQNDAAYYLNRFLKLLKWKTYKENILEIGCGDGSITRRTLLPSVENLVEKILAVDVSSAMIEHAKKHNNNNKIEFKVMDMSQDKSIKGMENTFDHIFAFYCIHWIVDTRSLLKRFHMLLKSNSQIFITALITTPVHQAFEKFYKGEKWSKYLPTNTTPFAIYTDNPVRYITELLEQTGYGVDFTMCERKTAVTDDFKSFMRSLVSFHSFTNHCIPTELREEFIEDFVETTCEFGTQLDSPTKYDWPHEPLVFIATKK